MKEKRIAHEFFENSLYRFIFLIVSYIGGALFTIITARALKPELFGIYTLAFSFSLILITIAEAGFSETLIRFISINERNPGRARAYFNYLFRIKISILLVFAIILALLARSIALFYNNIELFFPILVSSFYLIFYATMQFVADLLYAFRNIKGYVYKESLFQLSRLIIVLLVIFIPLKLSSSTPIFAAVFGSIITIVFLVFYIRKNYRAFFKDKIVQIDKKDLFKYLKYVSIGSISILFLFYTDILILGKFVAPEYISYYKTAYSLVMFVFSILLFTPLIYPIFARLTKERLKNAVNIFLYYLIILAIPMAVGLVLLSKYFIVILFGYSYENSFFPLLVLSLLILIVPLSELFRVLLNSRGETKYPAKIMTIGSIINIFLNFILILSFLKFGEIQATLGAALAIVLSRFYITISLSRTSKKFFGFSYNKMAILKPIFASLVMAFFIFFFTRFISGKANLILGILDILAGILIYFATLYLINGFSKRDAIYIINIVKPTLAKSRIFEFIRKLF